ncbi:hypothetical protein STSP2_01066 [Anaerohalosphaera lusitana]|uniref:DUF262 domain-containing protein n=1 Tax=Anaerohalosphaera lusitana TaxID=1936003 RepID=A0A1U9NJK4_9BACT|nr:DUF262 domain-containing protein [Anaerohalosphaera lusitana]AQT67914.1 hypothetical protein STSP2_01066 [Anaerohalosphaera lusitana]
MYEPRSLDTVFTHKLFRVPDYQRGYAWGLDQLEDFWEDLVNLPDKRSHYTGVLTLKEMPIKNLEEDENEFWLIEDHGFKLYHIVDGQQRLTTFIIFLQALIDHVRNLPENSGQPDENIFLTESLTIKSVQDQYLFMVKPNDNYRSYKFGYTTDNPSYKYMRYRILDEESPGTVSETFYTLRLGNALQFFSQQLSTWHDQEGFKGLQSLYRTLTKRFLFNEYIIKDEFDVFVAFETMNNRGKKLSDLELLKNRLVYLTTLYTEDELNPAARKELRDSINDAWKEVYYQLGRNKSRPLNDDDFLRAHWTMYFKYSRKTGRDYIRFLLDEQFSPRRVHKKVVHNVELEPAEEQVWEEELDENEDDNGSGNNADTPTKSAELRPTEIRDYVLSLKESSIYWFKSFYPEMAEDISEQEKSWLQRLNRVGMTYFRPLVMAILKNVYEEADRIHIFKQIERFIFIVFRMTTTRSNYRSSEFYNFARAVDRDEVSVSDIETALINRTSFAFDGDGFFDGDKLYSVLEKHFDEESGFYKWSGLKYFLYEYELSLLSGTRQKKVDWSDLLKTSKDKISIEHIYPQTDTDDWLQAFKGLDEEDRAAYKMSLGNLLLLSSAINSSLQNDSFNKKKHPKFRNDGTKARNGYSDGSHSEIEVSQHDLWGPDQIRNRGLKLLNFMEQRWELELGDEEEKLELLFPTLPDPSGSN